MASNGPDRLSLLPESLIGKTLSLLPLKEAVRTSVLSRQWRRHWMHATHLDLSPESISDDVFDRCRIVDNILTSIAASSLPIVSCNLRCPFNTDRFLLILIESSIRCLQIHGLFPYLDVYHIPECLFHCNTLRNLQIFSCYFPIPPYAYWCRLNTLCLYDVTIPSDGDRLMAGLISSCTLLQRLIFHGCHGVRHLRISSTRLCYLRIFSTSPISIVFEDTPQLLTADISLARFPDMEEWQNSDLTQLLMHPIQVEELYLELGYKASMVWREVDIYNQFPFSYFLKLKKLRTNIELEHFTSFNFFICLLGCCPYLEELHITVGDQYGEISYEIPLWDGWYFNCLTHHLTAAKIKFEKNFDEYGESFLSYLLANTPLLKRMSVDFNVGEVPAADIFSRMKRASPDAEITIRGWERIL